MLNKWSWDESLEEILLYLHIRDVSITIEIIIGVKVLCHRAVMVQREMDKRGF